MCLKKKRRKKRLILPAHPAHMHTLSHIHTKLGGGESYAMLICQQLWVKASDVIHSRPVWYPSYQVNKVILRRTRERATFLALSKSVILFIIIYIFWLLLLR